MVFNQVISLGNKALDKYQQTAVSSVLNNPVTMIWGPPGELCQYIHSI